MSLNLAFRMREAAAAHPKKAAVLSDGAAMSYAASYKHPRGLEFRDQLPVNATGKIVKRELA